MVQTGTGGGAGERGSFTGPGASKHGAQNLQTMKRVSLAILSLVQSYYDNRSLKGIRFTLSPGFEEHIETIFKLLNAQAIRNLLLPRSG